MTPSVFVTAAHHHAGLKRDAASVWIEDVTQSSFKVCLRELQNYAGSHEDVYVVRITLSCYMRFTSLQKCISVFVLFCFVFFFLYYSYTASLLLCLCFYRVAVFFKDKLQVDEPHFNRSTQNSWKRKKEEGES